jgi:predicted N-formylglutamate amidohydrolase
MAGAQPLLAGEDDPVILVNETGRSPVLLLSEHAGRRIPKVLGPSAFRRASSSAISPGTSARKASPDA